MPAIFTIDQTKVYIRAFVAAFDAMSAPNAKSDAERHLAGALHGLKQSGGKDWLSLRPLLNWPGLVSENSDAPLTPTGAVVFRAARIALAYLNDDASLLRPDETEIAKIAAQAAEKAPLEPVLAAQSALPSGDQPLVVDIAYATLRKGRAGNPRSHFRAATHVAIARIDPAKAEFAFQLSRPDGGLLDVFDIGGRLYRPILTPGSWSPIYPERFLAALRDGDAWRDAPQAPPMRDGDTFAFPVPAWLSDCCKAGSPSELIDMRTALAREGDIASRCKGLLIMGDQVLRIIPVPSLRILSSPVLMLEGRLLASSKPKHLIAAWDAGNLMSVSPMDLPGTRDEFTDILTVAFAPSMGCAIRDAIQAAGGPIASPLILTGAGLPLPSPRPPDFLPLADALTKSIASCLDFLKSKSKWGALAQGIHANGARRIDAFRRACVSGQADTLAACAQDLSDLCAIAPEMLVSAGYAEKTSGQIVDSYSIYSEVRLALTRFALLGSIANHAATLTQSSNLTATGQIDFDDAAAISAGFGA